MAKFRYERNFAVVETTGGKLRGFEKDDIIIFRGVKYATARRFHAPEPVKYREGVTDATSYGPVCPLLHQDDPQGELYVPHRFWPMSEDCQNLNIWTPALDGGKRAVLVWLHGGGYSAGSAIEQVAYDGYNMAACGDVVVVTVNHRLNILGYFDLSEFGEEYENSGNAGGDDIIMALRWIHDNIAAFGGDPDNVTVFGQSGGGGKVTTLLQSPEADGLYAKGMNMSGVLGMLADAKGSGREIAEAIMAELGISTVAELETIPYNLFADAYNKLRPEFQKAGKYTGCLPFRNRHYLGDPVANGFRGETKDIPLLIGTVFGEFTSFGPADYDKHSLDDAAQRGVLRRYLSEDAIAELEPLFKTAYPDRELVDLLRLDTMFRKSTIEYIKARAALNCCTYSYLFNMDQPIFGGLTPWHCSDIPYVFNNIDLVEYPGGDPNAESVQKAVFDSVIAFAKTGNPANKSLPQWQNSTADSENTMIIDVECKNMVNHDHALVQKAAELIDPVRPQIMRDMAGQAQH